MFQNLPSWLSESQTRSQVLVVRVSATIKHHLRDKRFAVDTDVKQAVICLQALHTHLFLSVIQALALRWTDT